MNMSKKSPRLLLLLLFSAVMLVFLLNGISAVTNDLTVERQNLLNFQHLIYITNIQTTPADIASGSSFILSFKITNQGTQWVRDVISKVSLPTEISNYQNIGTNKVAELQPGESAQVNFSLIVSPDAVEGLYKLPITVDYINYIGDKRTENETVTAIVASVPKLFAEVKSSEIYKGQNIGKITTTLANNGLANIKFLTIELKTGDNYEIINSRKIYIGSLDSDDSQGTDFRIKVNDKLNEIPINFILTYKDSLNRDYTQEVSPVLHIGTRKELGIQKSYTGTVVIVLIILAVLGYWYYKRHKKSNAKKVIFN